MDLQTQEKVSRLLTEQAEKLGKALHALRLIKRLKNSRDSMVSDATDIADGVLREIADYGKNPEDL